MALAGTQNRISKQAVNETVGPVVRPGQHEGIRCRRSSAAVFLLGLERVPGQSTVGTAIHGPTPGGFKLQMLPGQPAQLAPTRACSQSR